MLVTWRGNGLFVPVVFASVIVLGVTAAYFLLRLDNVAKTPDWVFGASMVVAGAVCWWLGRRMHAPPGILSPRAQRLLMCEPGERHDLFFVKFEYWGLLFVALGAWWLLTGG